MAKKKAKNADVESNEIILDGIPGADQMSEENANKEFKVDLNFEDEPKSEDDEVEFPKEGEVEEITEEELKTDTEEAEQDSEEEAEAETAEVESEDGETGEQTEVLADDAGDTQQSEGTVPESADGEAPEKEKEPMIPKSRFDEVLQKQKALQKQLDEAQNPPLEAIKEAPEYNFDEKEQEYQELVLNGEQDKATKLRAEIRDAEKQQMMFEMQSRMGQTVQQSNEATELQAKAVEIQKIYPMLDETSAVYDEVKTQEVLDLRDAYMIQGRTGAEALQKAVDLLMPSPVDAKTPDPVEQKVTEKKKVANVSKKIEAAESQPPAMKGKNKTEKKIDLNTLSAEEFDALPPETLKRMRGDFG
jgi:hypothetical protein